MSTRYKIIRGEYHIYYPDKPRQGPQPDGDTIAFKPDNRSLVSRLKWFGSRGPDFNNRGMIGVRFEGIDALETHFNGTHQELELADRARDFMLSQLGFKDIEFWEDMPNNIKSVSNNPQRGYIVANGIDSNGRIIAFVYPGKPKAKDGTSVFVNEELMFNSINTAILAQGLAYAAIYTSLPTDLAAVLQNKTHGVRAQGLGIFGQESFDTQRSVSIHGLDEIEQMVIWPKLFRRLVSFFSSGGSDLSEFTDWLREDTINRDDRLELPSGELGNMHDLVAMDENAIRLQWNPEDVVILPDNA